MAGRRALKYLAAGLALGGLLLFGPAAPTPAAAQTTIDVPLEDPAQEIRAKALFKLLRCLVCQNQSIDDSNADLARDLRILVRQRIAGGDSDEQAIGYIVDRYGDWVLLDPPFKLTTLALWLGPLAIFLFAVGWIIQRLRRRSAQAPAAAVPLSDDERRRLSALLDDTDDQQGPN